MSSRPTADHEPELASAGSPAVRGDGVASDRVSRAEWLAAAEATSVRDLADQLLARLPAPEIVHGPEVGLVMLQVREPVCRERFQLGELVVTRCEVRWGDAEGWAMRPGTDRGAALAAALCDAAAQVDAEAAARVGDLCRATRRASVAAERDEWARIAPTEVRFEELDR